MSDSLREKITILCICCFALCIRLYKIDAYGLYFDEKITLLVSQAVSPEGANQLAIFAKSAFTPQDFWQEKSLKDFNEAVARGDWGNSAFHYLLLNLWSGLFGISDFSLRLLSALFNIGTVLVLYLFVRRFSHHQQMALLVMILACIEPLFVAQSHIVRNYTLSILLTLWSSYLLLLILLEKPSTLRLLFYGLSVTLALFSHYLTITVFVGHGLFTLLHTRRYQTYVQLLLAMLLPITSMLAWMHWGGGQYSLKTVQDVEQFYRNIAQHPPSPNPYLGWIDPATPLNVFKKSLLVLGDTFIFTNGIVAQLSGIKNLFLSLLLGFFNTFCVISFLGGRMLRFLVALLVVNLLAVIFLYSVAPAAFLVLSFVPTVLWTFRRKYLKARNDRPFLAFCLLMTFFPLGWMVLQAFKAGHTVGINLRYVAFALPYALILVGVALHQMLRWEISLSLLLQIVMLVQLLNLVQTLMGIYNDTQAKYSFFSKARQQNPYPKIADLILRTYQPGDTVIYPSNTKSVFSPADTARPLVSVLDAQLVNLYLPKTATIPQKINPNEANKVVIWQKSTHKPKVLFNFEGLTYRY